MARELAEMGTSIPSPALGICMTAVLACKLGNSYGIAWEAQGGLDTILDSLSNDRWEYYINSVLTNDKDILYKLTSIKPYEKWEEIVKKYSLLDLNIKNPDALYLIQNTCDKQKRKVVAKATDLYYKLN